MNVSPANDCIVKLTRLMRRACTQAACPSMITLALMLSLHSTWPTLLPALTPTWMRPPVLRVVPAQAQWLQQEYGMPAQARRRSRVELIKAALST